MGEPIQLEPFDVATDEEELRRRALARLTLPRSEPLPSQSDVEAQATGDAYRAMPDAEADAIQSRSRDEGPGGRVYAAGDIPPPEPQRQRMMDRANARGSAAVAGQMAAIDAPTERQRPSWMTDATNPRSALAEPTPPTQHRIEEIPIENLVSGSPIPTSPAATPTSNPAGADKAAPPVASAPAGRDHTGADIADAFLAPLQLIGAGLAAAGGRPAPRIGLFGQTERANDTDAALRAEQRASQERANKLRLGMQREQLDAARADRQQQAASTDMYRQRQLEIQDQLAQGRLSEMQAREATVRNAREEQIAMRDPDSPISAAWREDAINRFRMLPPQLRGQMTEERFARMTGEQAQHFLSGAPRVSGGVRTSSAGGGGPRVGSPEADGVIADAVASGIPERTARAMYANPRTRAQLMQRIAAHPGQGSTAPGSAALEDDPLYQEALRQGVPPVTAREMVSDPDERARLRRSMTGAGIAERRANEAAGSERDVLIAAAQDAVDAVNEALPSEGQDIPGVGTLDSLRGGGLMASPEGRRMRTLAENAVVRFLRLESGGVIGPEEMRSEMERRGLGPGATERQFRDGLHDLQRDLNARAGRRERGSGQQQAGQQTPRATTIRIRIGGTTGSWPADRPLPPGAERVQ